MCFVFCKQKTAYEMRISDWSSDVCSSDLANSGRNWDYRYCWIRDAYYTVQALNRLGALDVLEGYLEYLRNVVDSAAGGCLQPVYGVGGETALVERQETAINGYRGMGPVRVGNQAYEQIQHDAYGQIVLSNTQAFFDQRLYRMAGVEDFRSLERVGDRKSTRSEERRVGKECVGTCRSRG